MGVLLIVAVVGADLEILLDACTIMGTEAIVEVHTPNELDFALSKGATMFLVNGWDRTTGVLHKNQVPQTCHEVKFTLKCLFFKGKGHGEHDAHECNRYRSRKYPHCR